MVFIYILKLKSNKYYVGKTEDPDLRKNILLRDLLIDNSDNKFIHDFLN